MPKFRSLNSMMIYMMMIYPKLLSIMPIKDNPMKSRNKINNSHPPNNRKLTNARILPRMSLTRQAQRKRKPQRKAQQKRKPHQKKAHLKSERPQKLQIQTTLQQRTYVADLPIHLQNAKLKLQHVRVPEKPGQVKTIDCKNVRLKFKLDFCINCSKLTDNSLLHIKCI